MSFNISKQRRDELIAKIEAIQHYIAAAPQDKNTGALLVYLGELEKEVKSKKYGLVFEEHRDCVDETLATHTPVFTEHPDLFIDNGGQLHFLIEGDNLSALQLLLKTHREKIDLIYIDPPYNRGKKDFRYDDAYVDADDAFKHSKWSSFMQKRLTIARQLLANDGVIFIHIDDNEQHVLRMLCDEMFGYANFMGIIVQNKLNSKNDSADIQKNHEYILVYRRTVKLDTEGNPTRLIGRTERIEKEVLRCADGYYYVNDYITTRGEGGVLANRSNLGYTVYYNPKTGDFFPEKDYDFDKALVSDDEDYVYTTNAAHVAVGYVPIRPPKVRNKLGAWTWEADKILRDKVLVEVVKVRGRGYSIKSRTFVPAQDVREKNGEYYYSGIFESNARSVVEFSTNDGSTSLTEDMGGDAGTFDNPKNLDMMMYLINLLNKPNPLILDFFAGSGTTGRAVLTANALYGGNRRFILCTNNENNICREVTYERIKRVIDKEGYTASLKYYQIGFVPISDRVYYEYADVLLQHVRELVELENGVNSTGNAEIAIVLTDEEMEAFLENVEQYTACKRLYRGYDILLSAEQESLLAEREIMVCVIPDYYYRDLEGGR